MSGSADWQNGLFGCFSNLTTCILGYFVPCYVHGKNAAAVGDDCLLCGLVFFVPFADIWFLADNRRKIREQKGIDGSLIGDLAIMCFCTCCAIVQQVNEVNYMTAMAQSMARE